MNALQGNDFNQTVNTSTASYVLVASDAGTRRVMNSASSTTITVNTSLFAAGDTLTILNIGAGVCTVTAGTATVSTTGTLALVQNAGGTLYFTSAGVSVFQADGVAASASALTLISATTIGTTVSSVTVSSAFSSTYDNYQITISGGIASTTVNLGLQLGSTTTGYYAGYPGVNVGTNASSNNSNNNASSFTLAGMGSANGLHANIFLLSPNLAKNTMFQSLWGNFNDVFAVGSGWMNNTTQFTAFTITPSSGTLTGGTIRVYGYANS
jgi:hypothetical protein